MDTRKSLPLSKVRDPWNIKHFVLDKENGIKNRLADYHPDVVFWCPRSGKWSFIISYGCHAIIFTLFFVSKSPVKNKMFLPGFSVTSALTR
jgi:hypothetical protein